MRAVLLKGFGGFEQLEYRVDVPAPRPGRGEVLVQVGAAGVNNTDINTRIGWYSNDPENSSGEGWSGAQFVFPRIQGADAAGRVIAVGAGVSEARVGERVLIEPVFRGDDGAVRYFGSECDGAFAEYAAVPARHAHPIRTALDDLALASFPCSYSAAENMLHRARVGQGERVLVTGASGGVGSAAVQLAKRRGALVTALAGRAKHGAVLDLGADIVLDRHAALAGNHFDVIIDVVGGADFPALLRALRPGGRYATAGAIAGPKVELDLRTLYLKDLALLGCTLLEPEVFPNLVGYIERGEIRPVVCSTFPLEQIESAQRLFLEKGHVGKIVLRL